jgi:hypothetical protein
MECVRIIPYTLFIPNNDARKTWRPRMLISRVILAPFECTGLIWENIIVVAWISAPDKKTSGMFRARIAGFVCHSTAAIGIRRTPIGPSSEISTSTIAIPDFSSSPVLALRKRVPLTFAFRLRLNKALRPNCKRTNARHAWSDRKRKSCCQPR